MDKKEDNTKDFMYLVFRDVCGKDNKTEKEQFTVEEEEEILYILEADEYCEFYQRVVDYAHSLNWHREKMFLRVRTYLFHRYHNLDDADAFYEAQVLLFIMDRLSKINIALS